MPSPALVDVPAADHPPPGNTQRFAALSEIAIGLLVAGVLTFFFARTNADPDLWGHLRFGLDALATQQIVQVDTYSYVTGDQPWVNHEWLAELVTATAYTLAGASGVIALKILLVLLIAAVVSTHLRQSGVSASGTGLLLVLMFATLLPWTQSLRPQLFSYVGLAVTLSILIRAERSSTRWLWWAPLVFGVWVNLHGGFVAGLAFVLLWAALHAVLGWRPATSRWQALPLRAFGPALAATLLATLINPYGMDLLVFLRTTLISRVEIAEWHPLHPMAAEGIGYVVTLVLGIAGFARSRRRPSATMVGLFLAAALLPLAARRHLPLFGIAATLIAGEHIADGWPRLLSERPARSPRRSVWILALPLCVGLAAAALAMPRFKAIEVDGSVFPVRAVQLIKDSGVEGRLAVFFDWGEYALWHLSPRLKVSVDGRRETVYSSAVYAESTDFIYGTGDWDRLLRRGADVVLVSAQFPVYNLMKLKPGWSLVYEDDLAAVFAPSGSPELTRLRAVSHVPAHDPGPLAFTFP
jgi:hypothetical protein